MSVVDIIKDQSAAFAHVHEFVLWPKGWKEYTDKHSWKIIKLDRENKIKVATQAGIYSLLVQPGIAGHPACSYLMYIGKTTSLRRRFGEYLDEKKRETGRPKIFRLLNLYQGYVYFCYSTFDMDSINNAENELMVAFIPPKNDQYPAEISKIMGAF